MFDTKNEPIKSSIAYVAKIKKTMAHSMSLNNRISCILGISIFVLKKYLQRVFNLMELKMISTVKQVLPSKTDNAENKNHTINDMM